MSMPTLTRRSFAGGALASSSMFIAGPADALRSRRMRATDVVRRIQVKLAQDSIPWTEPTVDTMKIGSPDVPVRGIVCTFMATLELMREAVAHGANFIISHEPIFYNHLDKTDFLADDPIYLGKIRFAREHGLAVWRCHDHLHRIRPEPVNSATAIKMGWQPFVTASQRNYPNRFTLPSTTLADLATRIAQMLPTSSMRVLGDPSLKVSRIANIGHGVDGLIEAFTQADVAIAPEAREWDSFEYMRDLIATGAGKGLIQLAHERGEEGGMAIFAQWLKPLVPGVSVQFLSSGEPFTLSPFG